MKSKKKWLDHVKMHPSWMPDVLIVIALNGWSSTLHASRVHKTKGK